MKNYKTKDWEAEKDILRGLRYRTITPNMFEKKDNYVIFFSCFIIVRVKGHKVRDFDCFEEAIEFINCLDFFGKTANV